VCVHRWPSCLRGQPHVDLLGAGIDGDGVDPLVPIVEDQTAPVAPEFVDECCDDASDGGGLAGNESLRGVPEVYGVALSEGMDPLLSWADDG
jgi:hypothetical protein